MRTNNIPKSDKPRKLTNRKVGFFVEKWGF